MSRRLPGWVGGTYKPAYVCQVAPYLPHRAHPPTRQLQDKPLQTHLPCRRQGKITTAVTTTQYSVASLGTAPGGEVTF